MGKKEERRRLRIKKKRQEKIVSWSISALAIIVPIAVLLLFACHVPVPVRAFVIYCSVVFLITGPLLIAFSLSEKFGFGKAGYGYLKRRGTVWMCKEEKKFEQIFLGISFIVLGIISVVATIRIK